jgi:HAD superfamily hydrolase (TIGR01662 family)
MRVDLVIPTIGRPSLLALLCSLTKQHGPPPEYVFLVDDRPRPLTPLLEPGIALGRLQGRIKVLHSGGRGPAAARNVGWRRSSAEWIAFLDDDVRPDTDWLERLGYDLATAEPRIAGSQGRLRVPLPADRRPTDWERNVAGLEGAPWITADMAFRRNVLMVLGGFDERFRRAYREDAEFALRLTAAGYQIANGSRSVEHPIRPARPFVSLSVQRGNFDDALMARLHGRDWHRRAGAAVGRRQLHFGIVAALALGLGSLSLRRQRLSLLAFVLWAAGTAEFAWRRIAPGPRTPREAATMLATSPLIPPLAVGHWVHGLWRWRSAKPLQPRKPAAVLFDRDGTLLEDVPYNGDPDRVVVMPSARAALDRLRSAGVRVGVVSNQSGVGRGLISLDQVEAVNRRLEELLGPVDSWAVCPHSATDECACRKPAPGLVLRAAAELGVSPEECVVVGDIGSDVEAARAAGARGILVPTAQTRPEEVASAPEVAADLLEAVKRAIRGNAA